VAAVPASVFVEGHKITRSFGAGHRAPALRTFALDAGQSSLRDLEAATGIPARTIASRLGLPGTVGMNESLGRLRRLYGFEIQAVRDAVAQLIKEKRSGVGSK